MQSPLHHLDLASRAAPVDASKGVWANEIPLQGYISLRGSAQDAAFVAGASHALGCALPVVPCTFAATPLLKVLWLSPDEWMIVCPRERLAALLRDLEQAFAGVRSQVADNSGGYTQILLKGRNAPDVLSHTSVYDLAALADGRVVGTTFGKSSLYLHREQAGFTLLLRRSFADYIWRYLERAATPYGFGVAALEAAGGARRDAA
jgi:sarcosine oxidase subunit gamma